MDPVLVTAQQDGNDVTPLLVEHDGDVVALVHRSICAVPARLRGVALLRSDHALEHLVEGEAELLGTQHGVLANGDGGPCGQPA